MSDLPIKPLRIDAAANYIDAIYRLTEGRDEAATTNALAEELGITSAGVSIMIKRLAAQGLVDLTPYEGVKLTAEGLRRALRIIRRHRILEIFLVNILGFGWHETHPRARALERVIDDAFEDRMDEILGHPTRCPHGNPIPTRDGQLLPLTDVALTSVEPGTSGTISRVTTDDADELKYLSSLGLALDLPVRLVEIAPFDGPVAADLNGRTVHLGPRLADSIRINVHENARGAARREAAG
ncbi:MAG: metal-dependent transcriptional regulator [Candidatus Sumerlaeaceae bacterium]|nr:metal-dependent transcriptional regulator [Candidatus Sumerlaeaceae bacterium]